MKHSCREYEAEACGFYEAAALPPRSEAHVFHFSCCEATLHSRRLLHELLRNSLNAPQVRFIEKRPTHKWVGLFSVCSDLNRCHSIEIHGNTVFMKGEVKLKRFYCSVLCESRKGNSITFAVSIPHCIKCDMRGAATWAYLPRMSTCSFSLCYAKCIRTPFFTENQFAYWQKHTPVI